MKKFFAALSFAHHPEDEGSPQIEEILRTKRRVQNDAIPTTLQH
jgi:hypothetical protein